MKAVLIPLDGGNPVELQRDLVVVGRQSSCDLRLDHKSISKLHCVLVKTDGTLLLRDLGSTNGCRVNGQRVTRAVLMPKDVLALARLKFEVFLGPDDAEVPVPDEPERDVTEAIAVDKPAVRTSSQVSLSDLPFAQE